MIVLVGESGSGKSTVEKMLVARGFEKVVSITTRQPRAGEVDGVDYHFIDHIDFLEMHKNDELAEFVNYEGNYYGIRKVDCLDDRVAVVEPNGLKQLMQCIGMNVTSFYLSATDEDRAMHMLQRGDSFDNVSARIFRDRVHFERAINMTDYILFSKTEDDLDYITNYIIETIRG